MAVVRLAASEAWEGREILSGPVKLSLCFNLPRPKNHYGTGKNIYVLKHSAPFFHTKTPDITKLIRAVEDALTGVVWRDDSQVYAQNTIKLYADGRSGVMVTIEWT